MRASKVQQIKSLVIYDRAGYKGNKDRNLLGDKQGATTQIRRTNTDNDTGNDPRRGTTQGTCGIGGQPSHGHSTSTRTRARRVPEHRHGPRREHVPEEGQELQHVHQEMRTASTRTAAQGTRENIGPDRHHQHLQDLEGPARTAPRRVRRAQRQALRPPVVQYFYTPGSYTYASTD